MEIENRQLRADLSDHRLQLADLKFQLLLSEIPQQPYFPPIAFSEPETDIEETEKKVIKMCQNLSRAKTITKEIREQDEKWKSILRSLYVDKLSSKEP